MNKPKILMCSEASFLQTGYSTYAKEVLSRLHKTNKYEIAEFASYGMMGDERESLVPWLFYPNAVPQSDNRYKEYISASDNVFGKWRFDRVVLDFKPDIVFDIRDFWMNSYQAKSIFRKCYNWVVMPTVDSAPQQEGWIDIYSQADAVLGYSEWAGSILTEQSNNHINYVGEASPGVDIEVFKPLNKVKCKESLGIVEPCTIIGSVMRNQKRKLLPDLFKAFRELLNKYQESNDSTGENLYLYLHTSYPDMGWDIPALLKENSVSNKVLFTYHCKSCDKAHASTFTHAIKHCPFCKADACRFPSSSAGVSNEQLAIIYNTFDIYVQYAICEGFGMPQVEAASCGVPIASVDYSAMSDIVKKLNGYPIKVERYFKELETEAYRAYPDNNHLIQILQQFLVLPTPVRQKRGFETRQLTEQFYNWDNIAKKWETVFDDILAKENRKTWNHKLHYMQPIDVKSLPKFNNNYELISYIFDHNLKNPSGFYDHLNLYMLKHIDYGFVVDGGEIKPYNVNNYISLLNDYIKANNIGYQLMNQSLKANNEDYLIYAHNRFNKKQKLIHLNNKK
jgi:glycosyltransferase involved in cell wall biosynthesis